MKLTAIKKSLQKNSLALHTKYSVKALYLFGSAARGDSRKNSDIDLIVEFDSDDIDLFSFIELKMFLEEILNSKVDLVTRNALDPRTVTAIERDSVRVA